MRTCICATFILIVLAGLPVGSARGGDDPDALQRRAIQRIDDYIDTYRKTGDPTSKMPELERARAELEAGDDAFLARGDLASAALNAIKQGDIQRMKSFSGKDQPGLERALVLYRRAEDLARKAHHPAYEAKALISQVRVETTLLGTPNWGAAATHAEQAVRLCEPLEDKALLVDALDNLAHAQQGRGDLLAAAATLDHALALHSKHVDAPAVVPKLTDPFLPYLLHMDRGGVHWTRALLAEYESNFPASFKDLELACEDFKRAREIAQQRGFVHMVRLMDDSLSRVELIHTLMEKNKEFIEKFFSKEIAFLFNPVQSKVLVVSEKFLPKATPQPKLIELLQRVLDETFTGNAQSYLLQGQSFELRGDNEAALRAYLKGVELLEADRRRLGDEQGRRNFLEDKFGCYYAAIRHHLERKQWAEAFNLMERARARTLSDLLASRDPRFSRPSERTLYAESRKLEAEIGQWQAERFKLASQPEKDPQATMRAKIERQLQDLEGQRRRVFDRMDQEAPKLRDLFVSSPASLEEVQRGARQGGFTILEYLVLKDSVIVWLIDGDNVQVRSVFLPRFVLADKVAALVESLKNRPQIRDDAFDAETAQALFAFLVRPMLPWIKTDRLVILPHEALNDLPFQVLLDPADRRYLGERFQITYAPSATILTHLNEPPALTTGKLLAVAAKGIDREVDTIAGLFPPNRRRVVKDARKSELMALAPDFPFLHLSVHGLYNFNEPLLSTLTLREDGQDEGTMTAVDLFGLPLQKASLVVLSACETGRVQASHGNEMLGMVQSLLYAGAGTLVLSRWKVDPDATALWMTTFYREGQSQPLGEAARRALRALKDNPQYQHPYYWASFLVIGR